MVVKKLIVITIFSEVEIIKKCLNSITKNKTDDDFDIFIVENPSKNSDLIEPFIEDLNVKKYIRFESNTWGKTLEFVTKEFKDFIKNYDIITYTDGDLFFEDFKGTYSEILNNLNKKNVLISSVDLSLHNLPKNIGGSEGWVLNGNIINGYNIKCTGMHMVTFKKSSIDILLSGRVVDSILCVRVKNNKKLWVSTVNNKATHLTWDLYKQKTEYYDYKKTKIINGLIQNINNNNKYKVLC